jgi:hypothetical protein
MRRVLMSIGMIGLISVFVCVLLAACGSNAATGSGGNPTPTPTGSGQAQKCGTVHTLPDGKLQNTITAKGIENCFWQHFQQCQPASLVFIAGGVDTVTTHTFTVRDNHGQCAAIDSVQLEIVPAKTRPAQTYSCASVSQQKAGLQFSQCGNEGTITVPDVVGMM